MRPIFKGATYQNAGMRVFDISDPYTPMETGALVPAAPACMVDKRPNRPQVIQSTDVRRRQRRRLFARPQCRTSDLGI
ncbi:MULTISPECIES: hypothetical protein [unclassified Mesorhizobium]